MKVHSAVVLRPPARSTGWSGVADLRAVPASGFRGELVQAAKQGPEERARRGLVAGSVLVEGVSGQFLRAGDLVLTPDQIWRIYVACADVRAAVDQIARRVSTWDWNVAPIEEIDPASEDYEAIAAEAAKVAEWLKQPNLNRETWQEVAMKFARDLLLYDVSAVEKVRARNGSLTELNVLRGSEICPKQNEHGMILGYLQTQFDTSGIAVVGEVASVEFKPDDLLVMVLHPNTYRPLGLPLLESVINEVITLLNNTDSVRRLLDSDEVPPGILLVTGIAAGAQKVLEDDLRTMRGQNDRIRILGSASQGAVDAKWVRLQRELKDVQVAELVDSVRRTIWRVFGVTPIEMGETDSAPRATAEVMYDVGTSHLIGPILELVEAKITSSVLSEVLPEEARGKVEFKFKIEKQWTPAERKEQADALGILVDHGIITRNEARKQIGLSPIEGGDVATTTGATPPTPVGSSPAPAPAPGAPLEQPKASEGGTTSDPEGTETDGPEDPAEEADRATGDKDPTNFPAEGDDEPVHLDNSEHEVFDRQYAEKLRTDYPEIWKKGGNIKGNEQYAALTPVVERGGKPETDAEEEAVRLREAWGARHKGNTRVPGVVAQVKWFVVGTLGERGMKDLLDEEKAKIDEKRARDGAGSHVHGLGCGCGPEVRYADADDLPSDWQPSGRFRGYRTLDLVALAGAVAEYEREVGQEWDEVQKAVERAFSSRWRPDMTDEDRAALRRVVSAEFDRLVVRWALATAPLYRKAGDLAAERTLAWTADGDAMTSERARQKSAEYGDLAMGYLREPAGLVDDLRDRLLAVVAGAVERSTTTPGLQTRATLDDVASAVAAAGTAFVALRHRIANWSGRLVELATSLLSDGLSAAGAVKDGEGESEAPEVGGRRATSWWCEWVAVGDAESCATCSAEGAKGFRPLSSLTTQPGGATECRARCRCVLVYWTAAEVSSGAAVSLSGAAPGQRPL
jgi:hypothetical protein